jgi:cobalt-precorrin 5A hydrolase
MIVAGIGCRAGCAVEDVLAAVTGALVKARAPLSAVRALCAPEAKRAESALVQAAEQLQKPLYFLSMRELQGQSDRALTVSERVLTLFGVPSVAETAALAGAASLFAGSTPQLLGPRHAVGSATCALASSEKTV